MKYLSIIAVLSILFPLSFLNTASKQAKMPELTETTNKPAPKYKRYKIKSGIVKYKVSGTMTGTETMYFDEWGHKEAKFSKTEMKIFGMVQKSNKLTILDGKNVFDIDLDKRTATKTENSMYASFENKTDKEMDDFGEDLMTKMGGKKVGTETVFGKNCEIWEIATLGSKIWVWKNLLIKSETNMLGMKINMMVTELKVNVSVPSGKFQVPSGIEIKTQDMQNVPFDPSKMFGN